MKLIGQHRLSDRARHSAGAEVEGRGRESPTNVYPDAQSHRFGRGASGRFRQPECKVEGRWDFNAPELARAYADWLKARDDVPFNETQRINIFKLAEATVAAKGRSPSDWRNSSRRAPIRSKTLRPPRPISCSHKSRARKTSTRRKPTSTTPSAPWPRWSGSCSRPASIRHCWPRHLDHGHRRGGGSGGAGRPGPQGDPCTAEFYGFPGKLFTAPWGASRPTHFQGATHAPRLLPGERSPGNSAARHVRRHGALHQCPRNAR